ncbi:MAG TPA: phosphopantetheine-binding protein [Geothrix sp.]|nr:phosphopantetheine-binding protein [Geothrix sp.]
MGFTPTTRDIKAFIIDTLVLEDLTPDDIADDESLFEGGLGLDSIDTLELAIALKQRFNLQLDEESSLRERLGTVKAIAEFLTIVPAGQEKKPLAG